MEKFSGVQSLDMDRSISGRMVKDTNSQPTAQTLLKLFSSFFPTRQYCGIPITDRWALQKVRMGWEIFSSGRESIMVFPSILHPFSCSIHKEMEEHSSFNLQERQS